MSDSEPCICTNFQFSEKDEIDNETACNLFIQELYPCGLSPETAAELLNQVCNIKCALLRSLVFQYMDGLDPISLYKYAKSASTLANVKPYNCAELASLLSQIIPLMEKNLPRTYLSLMVDEII